MIRGGSVFTYKREGSYESLNSAEGLVGVRMLRDSADDAYSTNNDEALKVNDLERTRQMCS